jgi:hypothetical protein
LRNLDLSAHITLFESPRFKEKVIEPQSISLSSYITSQIADLFEQPVPSSIVLNALNLKVSLLLTTNLYKFRTFAPGTRFDGTHMIAESKSGASIKIQSRKGRKSDYRVKLCLFPALYCSPMIIPPEEQVWIQGPKLVVVQPQNFLLDEEDIDPDELPVSKAIVILDDTDGVKSVKGFRII